METLSKNKGLLTLTALLVLGIFVYNTFFSVSDMAVEPVATATQSNADLLELANELANINFNRAIFSSPGYRALIDFSVPLLSQPIGRSNPFDVIGRD